MSYTAATQPPGAGESPPAPTSAPPAASGLESVLAAASELIGQAQQSQQITPAQRMAAALDVAATARVQLKRPQYAYLVLVGNAAPELRLTFDGWKLLGVLSSRVFGDVVLPHVTSSARIADGWEAHAGAVTPAGLVLATAQSHCTTLENRWKEAGDVEVRGMAEARAGAKAMQFALGWILPLCGRIDVENGELRAADAADAGDDTVPAGALAELDALL